MLAKGLSLVPQYMNSAEQATNLMHIIAFLVHSFGEMLHSMEEGAQGLLAGQGLPECPQ